MKRIRTLLRPILLNVQNTAMAAAVRFPWLANLYYCVDRGFEKEHRAVLAGRLRYRREVRAAHPEAHIYRLRRNVHRLEKGLISRPRREVFAAAYLGETVQSYEALAGVDGFAPDNPLWVWATDVLDAYFKAVSAGQSEKVDRLRARYHAAGPDAKHDPTAEASPAGRVPYRRDLSPLAITADDLLELARRRRSVRWYDDRPVSREAIDRAVTIAGYSPSACNRQPFYFRVFDDPQRVAELAGIPMGTRGFNHQFPVFVVIVGSLNAYPYNRDRHVIYIDASLAAMSLQFALEVQGIASCSINWPDIAAKEQQMASALGLRPDERVIMCLSAGYPDPNGEVPYSQKKSLDELRSYNA